MMRKGRLSADVISDVGYGMWDGGCGIGTRMTRKERMGADLMSDGGCQKGTQMTQKGRMGADVSLQYPGLQ